MKKPEWWEWRPQIHKIAERLLLNNPQEHAFTIANLFGKGTGVPAEDIPDLVKAFEEAKKTLEKEDPRKYKKCIIYIDCAITALKNQAKALKEEPKTK